MGIQAAPEVKFSLIREATQQDNNRLSVSLLCEIAGVSRSGYYNWINQEPAPRVLSLSARKGGCCPTKKGWHFCAALP